MEKVQERNGIRRESYKSTNDIRRHPSEKKKLKKREKKELGMGRDKFQKRTTNKYTSSDFLFFFLTS